ncbi:MAG: glutaredoxin-dependent peroxiredoxin [Thermoplasmata archaeon]|jgi:peroxiredoxin|nr:glutaredoxin-dependent peroxiredoxin [Thermoplasmata archaeon]MEA3166698.1 glutaredoxin-dependent peroxiredoxin [Thermoplasmata archaeon]
MAQTMTLTTTAPAVGTKLPDFTLKVATKDGVSDFKLSDHLGKGPIVFAFFPLAFTGGCTKEMCDFRDNLSPFASLNAQVYGFSIDTPASNRAFATREGLQFGILSDPNRTFIGKHWPVMPMPIAAVDNVAKRGAMVIAPDGTVKWVAASDDVSVWVGTEEVRKHLA